MVRQGYEGGRDSEGLLVRPRPQVVGLSQGTSVRQSPEMEPCDKPLCLHPFPLSTSINHHEGGKKLHIHLPSPPLHSLPSAFL